MTEIKKISRENWESSRDKWVKIVEKTKNRERFVHQHGFPYLRASGKCGYCFNVFSYCKSCHLNKTKVGIRSICGDVYWGVPKTIFWKYVNEMRKSIEDPNSVNWDTATKWAQQILDAILADEPEKE
ncbi:hypothetical protein ACFLZC_00175 [Patescibacteria group bacterium]